MITSEVYKKFRRYLNLLIKNKLLVQKKDTLEDK